MAAPRNFSLTGTESKEMISVIVDSLLSESMHQVKVDSDSGAPINNMDFFKALIKTIPPFSPGEGSQSQVEAESQRELSPPDSPLFPSQSASPMELPLAPCPSPIEMTESSSPDIFSWSGSVSQSSADLTDFSSKRSLPVSPGLDLLSTQGPCPSQQPFKKMKVEYHHPAKVEGHDVNANISQDTPEKEKDQDIIATVSREASKKLDIEDRVKTEHIDLIRKLAQKFLHSVPMSSRYNMAMPLNSAGDGMEAVDDTERKAGEELSGDLVMIKETSSRVQLLNRAPRVGLSRLQSKLTNLHNISVSEKEE